jgi:D-methionine transport system ATP-binding protein
MSVIKEICHRLAMISDGKIVEQANVIDFFTRPETDVGKRFIHSQAIRMLPESVQARLSPQNKGTLPLVRISFLGDSAEAPLITYLVQNFSLHINILQAQFEKIRDEMIGMMLVELSGNLDDVEKGRNYLHAQGAFTEVIGYVQPIR